MNKEEAEWEKAAAEYRRLLKENPIELVCKQHNATKEQVRKLRERGATFRMIASQTSDRKCELPTCGEALCLDAGIKE